MGRQSSAPGGVAFHTCTLCFEKPPTRTNPYTGAEQDGGRVRTATVTGTIVGTTAAAMPCGLHAREDV